jgi:hypothetical protein
MSHVLCVLTSLNSVKLALAAQGREAPHVHPGNRPSGTDTQEVRPEQGAAVGRRRRGAVVIEKSTFPAKLSIRSPHVELSVVKHSVPECSMRIYEASTSFV